MNDTFHYYDFMNKNLFSSMISTNFKHQFKSYYGISFFYCLSVVRSCKVSRTYLYVLYIIIKLHCFSLQRRFFVRLFLALIQLILISVAVYLRPKTNLLAVNSYTDVVSIALPYSSYWAPPELLIFFKTQLIIYFMQ